MIRPPASRGQHRCFFLLIFGWLYLPTALRCTVVKERCFRELFEARYLDWLKLPGTELPVLTSLLSRFLPRPAPDHLLQRHRGAQTLTLNPKPGTLNPRAFWRNRRLTAIFFSDIVGFKPLTLNSKP